MADRHVLYLSYDGMTSPLGQSQVLPYLEGLVAEGYTISLVSFEKKEAYAAERKTIEKICSRSSIAWYPQKYHKSPPILSTLYDIFKLWLVIRRIYAQKPYFMIHCRGYITPFAALPMKRREGVRFLFDMRGFFPDEKVDGGDWNVKNPVFRLVYRYFKKKELEFFSKANHTVCLTMKGREIIHQMKGIRKQPIPIEVIPCCVDTQLFDRKRQTEEARQALHTSLGIQSGDFVLSYLGSIGTWYMLDEMLRFFAVLKEKKPRSKFLFITGEQPSSILEKADEYGIAHSDLIIRKAARKEVPLYISLSQASIFFIMPVYSKQASSPTKQGEIMSMGVPLICNDGIGDSSHIVRKYDAGIVLTEFTDAAYSAAVDQLDALEGLDRKKIRQGAKEFYSLQRGVEKYRAIYDALYWTAK